MRKFFQFLFFIFIILTVFFIVSLILSERGKIFLENHQDLLDGSVYNYISMVSIAHNNDNTISYIEKEPLFKETYTLLNDNDIISKLTISFYALIEKNENSFNNALAIIINDIYFKNDMAIKDEFGIPIIDLNIHFNEPILFNTNYYEKSKETFIPIKGSLKRILLFNHENLKNENNYVEFEKIELTYRMSSELDHSFLILSNSLFDSNVYSDDFDPSFNRDLKNVSVLNRSLLNKYNLDDLNDYPELYYNEELIILFKKFDFRLIYYLLIDISVLLVLYYLLFYHKYVMINIRQKRKLKQEKKRKLLEKYLNEKDGK